MPEGLRVSSPEAGSRVDGGSSAPRPRRVAVVGISSSGTCGVRDHAALLGEELARANVSCEFHWLRRGATSLRGSRSEIMAWTRGLASELDASRPDAILLHYSVFSYSYRGIPLFVRPVLSVLRASRIPVISVLHELAYPWGRGGWRGGLWALTQRAVLREVMAASAAVIVTLELHSKWLASRPWLSGRRVLVAPVFSNLPPPSLPQPSAGGPERHSSVVGLFGYSAEGAAVAVTLDAVRLLVDRGVPVQLILLGAPGRSSPAGEAWLQAARSRRLTDALSFSGVLAAQELSDALAACEVLLFADAAGPTSRKGTLAASLASGVPVVAIDGPHTWTELIGCEAARVVAPTSRALADALADLLADGVARQALGARGRSFAEREMGVARTAQAVTTLLDEVLVEHGS